MIFPHKKHLPNGAPRTDDPAQLDMLDKWYQQESTWAAGYILMLERHLSQRLNRCKQCPYRNQQGSGCNDEIPD